MIIQHLSVSGLFGTQRSIEIEFNQDINILTGKNGSGKTTVLKLLWYIISGNIEHAIREIQFQQADVVTNEYSISIARSPGHGETICLNENGAETVFEPVFDADGDPEYDPVSDADNEVKEHGSSLFFPTFRRIEGGFTIRSAGRNRYFQGRLQRQPAPLEEALADLSRRLTVGSHTFVASISTLDIVQLLMRQYTEMSERVNTLQHDTSQQIIDKIKNFKKEKSERWGPNAENVLDDIRAMIELLDGRRTEILAPLNAVRTLAEHLFQHAGINLGERISFGDAANAVNSDSLSAGEKQMLSFICYNAFCRNGVLFIDEPELSLHVDWQRQLFSIMQNQGTGNQFIVATHSPFIYGKFPEKEITISTDRGDAFRQAE